MKTCPTCGNVLSEGAKFCGICGNAVPDEAPATPVVEEPVAPVILAAPEYQAPISEPIAEQPAPNILPPDDEKPEKKKGKGKLIALICIAAVVLAAIVFVIIGFATNWFAGPMDAVRNALNKTFDAQSYTEKYTYNLDNYEYSYKAEYVKDFATIIEYDDGEIILMYDNKEYRYSDDYAYIYDFEPAEDENEEEDEDEVIYYTIGDLLRDLFMNELPEEAELEKLIKNFKLDADVDELMPFLQSLEKDCFSKQEWLEDFLKYEKDGNTFNFKIDCKKLLKEIVNKAYDADAISKSDKKELLDLNIDTKIKIKIEIENGYAVRISYSIEDGENEAEYERKISKINSTDISQDDVDEIVKDVEDYIAEHYRNCTMCGESNKKTNMNEVNEKFYCYSCYYEMDYCDICNDFVKEDTLEYIRYYYRCKSCADEYKAENYTKCKACSDEDDKNNMYKVNSDYYCYDCFRVRDNCYNCGEFVHEDSLTYAKYHYYCTKCYASLRECYNCGYYYTEDNMTKVENHFYCPSCTEHFGYCTTCGEWAYMYTWKSKKYCYPCYMAA